MKCIDRFALQEHAGPYESWPLQSQLFYCGTELGIKVAGYVIEQQFELPDYYLLFLNWDCPFEESCEIVALNKQLKLLGSKSITASYNTYHLQAVTELSQNTYQLHFNSGAQFKLIINYPHRRIFRPTMQLHAIANN